jgi:steroid delta-isomerase-like uncharacterized protein
MDRRWLLAGLATAAATPALAAPDTAARHAAEQFAATLTAHDMAGFAALFAPDYRNHQTSAAAPPPPATLSAKQATIGFFQARLVGLPDLRVGIETMLATNDMVAASFVYEGTHRGTLFGIPPTGRRLRFTSCDIFRLADGRFVEHWGMGDIAGIMAQLKA